MPEDARNVLVVTKDKKISSMIRAMLVEPLFSLCVSEDFNDARRKCVDQSFSIIIVDYGEGEGSDFAIDISSSLSAVLLLAPLSNFDQISYRVECYGIITMTKPFDQFYFYNMIKAAIAFQYKMALMSSQTTRLKVKMDEIKILSRAKMLLMQELSLTEEEAHHWIEKEAMNRGEKKLEIANEIVKKYG